MRRFAAVLGSLAALACKPTVGSSCEKGEARCQDKQTQLICSEGKLIAAPCRGPAGCATTATGVACDISTNQPGDACSKNEEGAAVCADDKRILACAGGAFVMNDCRGPAGCSAAGGFATCDTTRASVGDSCKPPARGCSLDGKQVLSCQAGKMTPAFFCLGPNACKASSGKIDCDLTIARDDDPCLPDMEGKVACNIDQTSIVVCKGGKFVIESKCDKGKRCSTEGGSISCAKAE